MFDISCKECLTGLSLGPAAFPNRVFFLMKYGIRLIGSHLDERENKRTGDPATAPGMEPGPRDTEKQEEKMKQIIMLGMAVGMLLISLGGCYVRTGDHDRDGRHDWGERHDRDGGEHHDRDGGHEDDGRDGGHERRY